MSFRLLIATTGGFADQAGYFLKLDALLVTRHPDVEIVIGWSLAGDAFGREYAQLRGYSIKHFEAGFLHLEQIVEYCHGACVAWDGVSKGTEKLINRLKATGKPCKIHRFEPAPVKKLPRQAVVIEGEVLIPETKVKSRKPASSGQTIFRYDYKRLYHEAHERWFQREYPHAYKDGHYTPKKKIPDVTTANGIASYIIDHAAWTGNYANRINVMGRVVGGITRTQSGATFDDRKFIKSSTKTGTPDIDLLINGTSIKPEIKIGRDSESVKQEKQAGRIERAGGLRPIFRSIDDYFDIYYRYAVKQSDLFGE
jgi:hypothetical protein